ncbi:ATP-binding protein [Massilia sp. H-1]|nr:ATP-binding protein [Massilia sp. H-1]
MAAEVIARELGLLIFRIDLSAVVSKYIGETEKNLRKLFDAAEDGGAILFFDEADALFGKRSEVRDSHDRYANIEVNYLLQRIESFRGLAILASNMKSSLDSAFLRRLRFVVNFPFPGLTERAAIWKSVFPHQVPLARLDYDRLGRLNLTGGSIHNIALNAAFVAAGRGVQVSMPLLLESARTELRKLDKPVNEAELRWVSSAPIALGGLKHEYRPAHGTAGADRGRSAVGAARAAASHGGRGADPFVQRGRLAAWLLAGGALVPRMDAPPIEIGPRADPVRLGQQIAQSLYGAMAQQTTTVR